MGSRSILGGALLVACLAAPAAAGPGGSVDIGVDLPSPPPLAPVPGTPVMYAPGVPANYFFYSGQYYTFVDGVWYAGSGYRGPWTALAPEFVPRPILAVPVAYYRVLPRAWWAWRIEAPPRWEPGWGRRWDEPHAELRAERR
jgi:hypothetical protein